jgi:23S rRNA pseudouridine2605 synthase
MSSLPHLEGRIRLNQFLARCGLGSRRKTESLILAGRVKINGKVVQELASYVIPGTDKVLVDGKKVYPEKEEVYWIFHKPAGVIASRRDPFHSLTVFSFLPDKPGIFTVGRLDKDTTGALLVTNDGELAQRLAHPSFGVEKVYIVKVDRDLSNGTLKDLSRGIDIGEGQKARGYAKKLRGNGFYSMWQIRICEGKKREIKRIFKKFGANVKALHRKSFACISADDLSPGSWRNLTKNEISILRRMVDLSN